MPGKEKWTNSSVRLLAGDDDPVDVITKRARSLVLAAIDKGWTGPPFDPLTLGDILKISFVPRSDVRDARTVAAGDSFCIEYNPTRPRARVRYSIAHEIAHTLFPDCHEQIRNRAQHTEIIGDDWQLEALCNIAAAEFLMPIGSLGAVEPNILSIDKVLDLRQEYDVSTEAILLRATRLSAGPLATFAASRIEDGAKRGHYRFDYIVKSADWEPPVRRSEPLGPNSIPSQCSAIGFTAKGAEVFSGQRVEMECVGIPPYPGSSYPRVAGLLKWKQSAKQGGAITFLRGDAMQPRGTGQKIVAQVVNDGTPNWGGGGFAQGVRRKWPGVQESFRHWLAQRPRSGWLGTVHVIEPEAGTSVASMVAQRGYGPSNGPRIRYSALERCLSSLATIAVERGASVHMPRIGCGQAGGRWSLVQELIADTLVAAHVPVFVYDLPGGEAAQQQGSLPL
jgi:O-acetyl-ADP-ribose deacetylase (regulator of RNase III)